jgi:hypothetical protein
VKDALILKGNPRFGLYGFGNTNSSVILRSLDPAGVKVGVGVNVFSGVFVCVAVFSGVFVGV